jgi:8-oxo-dGTP diphosphatase
VAVGIIVNPHAEVLVALRPDHNPLGGLWEFPGGKFEPGESTFDALKRELSEEIGVNVLKAHPLICIQHNYETLCVELDTWHIIAYEGTPYGKEGQTIQWVKAQQLRQLRFPEGNKVIVQKVLEDLDVLAEKNSKND